jgi:hypothetical protein
MQHWALRSTKEREQKFQRASFKVGSPVQVTGKFKSVGRVSFGGNFGLRSEILGHSVVHAFGTPVPIVGQGLAESCENNHL